MKQSLYSYKVNIVYDSHSSNVSVEHDRLQQCHKGNQYLANIHER